MLKLNWLHLINKYKFFQLISIYAKAYCCIHCTRNVSGMLVRPMIKRHFHTFCIFVNLNKNGMLICCRFVVLYGLPVILYRFPMPLVLFLISIFSYIHMALCKTIVLAIYCAPLEQLCVNTYICKTFVYRVVISAEADGWAFQRSGKLLCWRVKRLGESIWLLSTNYIYAIKINNT